MRYKNIIMLIRLAIKRQKEKEQKNIMSQKKRRRYK